MAGKSDLQSVAIKWNQRADQIRAAGLPDSVWKPLAVRDIQGVLQGHAPIGDREVNDALLATVHKSPITDPGKGHDWTDIIGNIPSDVKNLVTGFPMGVKDYVTSLPEQMHGFYQLTGLAGPEQKAEASAKYGLQGGDVGDVLRDIGRVPVFSALVPGLQTVGNLTTPEGRDVLKEHPVSTAIDVGAAFALGGNLGAFGTARAASEAGTISRAGAEAAKGFDIPANATPEEIAATTSARDTAASAAMQEAKRKAPGTALGALQSGEPYRALGRAALAGAEKVPFTNINRVTIRNTLLTAGLHPDLVERLSRPFQEIRGRNLRQMNQFLESDIVAPILKLDDTRRTVLNDVLNRKTALTEEEAKVLATSHDPITGQPFIERSTQPTVESQLTDPRTGDPLTASPATPTTPNPRIDENFTVTEGGRQVANDPNADPVARSALQKAINNETFQNDIELQTIATRTRRYMDRLAKENPNIVGVRQEWSDPFGQEYYYHKSHEVGRAFEAQRSAYAAVDEAANRFNIATERHQLLNTPQTLADRMESWKNFMEKNNEATIAKNKFYSEFSKRAPASYYPTLAQETRGRAITYAQGAEGRASDIEDKIGALQRQHDAITASGGTVRQTRDIERQIDQLHERLANEGPQMPLDEAINRINGAVDTDMLKAAIGPEAVRMMADVEKTWRALATQGTDPIFLPNTKAARVEHVAFPTVIPEAPAATAHMSKNTAFNLSRSVHDVAVGLVESKRQALTEAGTREFAMRWVKPWAQHSTSARNEIQDAIRNGGPTNLDIVHQAEIEMDRNYAAWDPEKHGFGMYFPSVEGGTWLIPKGVERSIKLMGFEERGGPLRATYDRVMKVWRFSVLTTPRHMSHVILGGQMMGLLRDANFIPHFITNFKEAYGIMKGDEHTLLAKFGGNTNDFELDQLYNTTAAKSLGRIAKSLDVVSKGVRKVNKFEESAVMMYKITQMLAQEKKLARARGVATSVVRDEAISLANKMFVDMNAMLPFERVVLRKIFPFYGFTRHLFRYLMTYPADHPYAAAILTNFANQHEKDWDSGLPRDLSFMFFLGEPDVNGNVNAIDYRSIDPFRSFYNVFTLAGFFSQVNPTVQLVAQQAGINVLSATPELYPDKHYNPNTGQMEADQPPNLPLRLVETLLPTTQALDAKFALSDQFRNLKLSDPEGYKHRLYTALGIPFSGFPFSPTGEQVNVNRKTQNAQMKRYQDAQDSINKAIQTGDFTKAKRYAYVPVPTSLTPYIPREYATPQVIEAVYRKLSAAVPGVSLHAVLPKPTRRRTG